MQKYSVNQQLIETVLSWVKSKEIAIPEIQRPFVWNSSKVRDLMDSLYQGYPIGYLIAWKNPNIRLKDGSLSEGKKILIDGQQRVTALTAALLGEYVLTKGYQRIKIKIAFNPLDEKFEVLNPAISKDKNWVPDISEIITGNTGILKLVRHYLTNNPKANEDHVEQAFTHLINLTKKQVGIIELAPELDIDTVTEIFIRINSKGVVLSQADFAMSKIASDEKYGGNELRKAIDYFCRLSVSPEFSKDIIDNDKNFAESEAYQKIQWLKSKTQNLYSPEYTDLIRVAFTSQFNRGKLSDLVNLLSGRNFETRTYEESIAEASFERFRIGVFKFVSQTNFERFLMIIKSAGFISPKLIRSQSVLNFAYILYLKLIENDKIEYARIESYVRRWFVYSILTGRYSSSAETNYDFDMRQLQDRPFEDYLREKEEGELSDAFWASRLTQSLNSSVANSPYFNVYLAAQVKNREKGFLSKDITITDMVTHRGDIHHLFPRDFLKKNGLMSKHYNQIANYTYMQSEINIKIGNKSPKDYLSLVSDHVANGKNTITAISTLEELKLNLVENCIPETMMDMDIEDYDNFLAERRSLMAKKN